MSPYHLEELEMGIAELPDGRLTNAVREQARWQPAQPVSFYCRYCHLQVYPSRRKQYVFFAHPVTDEYRDCPEVQATISYLKRQVELAAQFKGINPLKPVTEWYCVWCHRFYTSPEWPVRRCCPKCREGIYSIPTSQVIDVHGYSGSVMNNAHTEPLAVGPLLRLAEPDADYKAG